MNHGRTDAPITPRRDLAGLWTALRLWVLAASLSGHVAVLPAQAAAITANEVKVGYIYNFLRYVSWPDGATAHEPLVVAVWSDPALAAELSRTTATRKLEGRAIVVRSIDDLSDIKGAHALFIPRKADRRIDELVNAAAGGVLIITESEKALDRGSVINFVEAGDRIRFEVSLVAAQQRKLRISARMLSVAINVRTSMLDHIAAIPSHRVRWL